jgi:hypothetical protein
MAQKTSSLCLLMICSLIGFATQLTAVEPSPPPDAYPAEVATAWFDTLYDVVKTEKLTPPQAARVYGIVSVALYETLVRGSQGHRPLVGQLNDLASVPSPRPGRVYHWPTVANSAMATAVRGLFPAASAESVAAIGALEQIFAGEFQAMVRPVVYERSVAHGREVAEAILVWAAPTAMRR